jgi:hypothetical protein
MPQASYRGDGGKDRSHGGQKDRQNAGNRHRLLQKNGRQKKDEYRRELVEYRRQGDEVYFIPASQATTAI